MAEPRRMEQVPRQTGEANEQRWQVDHYHQRTNLASYNGLYIYICMYVCNVCIVM